MIAPILTSTAAEIIYPDCDGNPMSDNTKQFRWIVTIKENLELLFAEQPEVFVAGDLLWYPVEGNNTIRQAPDIMVAIGRPKGDRGSYQQWKEAGIPPQVVFEILSPGNRLAEMQRKLSFYDRYGVSEYYIYDPDRIDFAGWIRVDGKLESIVQEGGSANDELQSWVSPLLAIRFMLELDTLTIYRPDGQQFLSFLDLDLHRQAAEQRADTAEQRADTAEQRAARMAVKLQELGIDPTNL